MATTRIMPFHVGKGRTESRAISDIIDYVANQQKHNISNNLPYDGKRKKAVVQQRYFHTPILMRWLLRNQSRRFFLLKTKNRSHFFNQQGRHIGGCRCACISGSLYP